MSTTIRRNGFYLKTVPADVTAAEVAQALSCDVDEITVARMDGFIEFDAKAEADSRKHQEEYGVDYGPSINDERMSG
jgi:hypothetical protein